MLLIGRGPQIVRHGRHRLLVIRKACRKRGRRHGFDEGGRQRVDEIGHRRSARRPAAHAGGVAFERRQRRFRRHRPGAPAHHVRLPSGVGLEIHHHPRPQQRRQVVGARLTGLRSRPAGTPAAPTRSSGSRRRGTAAPPPSGSSATGSRTCRGGRAQPGAGSGGTWRATPRARGPGAPHTTAIRARRTRTRRPGCAPAWRPRRPGRSGSTTKGASARDWGAACSRPDLHASSSDRYTGTSTGTSQSAVQHAPEWRHR